MASTPTNPTSIPTISDSTPSNSTSTPTISTSTSTRETDIGNLREQIFANATTLFPHLVATSNSYTKTGRFDPQETFEVITTASNSTVQATLVSGAVTTRRPVARSGHADGVAGALADLLKVLGEALGWYTDTLLGEMENVESTESGVVNFAMVEDGYHFAHVQRWAQGRNTTGF